MFCLAHHYLGTSRFKATANTNSCSLLFVNCGMERWGEGQSASVAGQRGGDPGFLPACAFAGDFHTAPCPQCFEIHFFQSTALGRGTSWALSSASSQASLP